VIDDRLGLEIDGRKYHANTFERDSAKAVSIALMGLIPLRVSANRVLTDWDRVLAAIELLLGNSGVVPRDRASTPANRRRGNGRRRSAPEFPKVARARAGP
jgi:hypothetical protein